MPGNSQIQSSWTKKGFASVVIYPPIEGSRRIRGILRLSVILNVLESFFIHLPSIRAAPHNWGPRGKLGIIIRLTRIAGPEYEPQRHKWNKNRSLTQRWPHGVVPFRERKKDVDCRAAEAPQHHVIPRETISKNQEFTVTLYYSQVATLGNASCVVFRYDKLGMFGPLEIPQAAI